MIEEATSTLSYLWQVPGKPVSVIVNLGVVDRLGLEVQTGCRSLPRRGLEIGGLLLGTTRRSRGSIIVEIDDFELLESEHAVGPSYLMSGDDRQRLKERMRRRAATRGPSVVGFYRSHTRKDFAITVEDVDLMSEYFSDPAMVLLLIHATPNAALRGGFFMWEGRSIRTMTPYQDFPFRRAALMAGGYDIQDRASVPIIAEEPHVVRSPRLTLPSVNMQAARRIPVFLRELRHRASLNLQAARRIPAFVRELVHRPYPKHLKLVWFAAGGLIAGAVAPGILPVGQRPPVRVPTRQSLSRTRTRPLATADRAELIQAVAEPQPAVAVSPEAASTTPILNIAAPVPQPRRRGARNRVVQRTPFHLAEAPAVSAALAHPEIPALPEPPPLLDQVQIAAAAPPNESDFLKPTAPRLSDPFVTVTVDADAGRPGLLGKIFGRKHKQTGFVPPAVVREPELRVPSQLRERVRGQVPIDVKLYVDRAGKVEYAELLSKGTGRNRDLAELAVFSSRHYEFAPAHEGGDPVPAEVVLRFAFGR